MSEAGHQSQPKATYEDVLKAPAHQVAEILDGELILSPRPAPRHAVASSAIGGSLNPAFGRRKGGGDAGPGGWWILFEPELHLGEDIVVPDLAGWRRSRMPVPPEEAFFTLAPDWTCEVISPRSAGLDRVGKMRLYAREGVINVWLVEPVGKTLEVYRLEEGRWILVSSHDAEEKVRAEPFDAIELDLSEWWVSTAEPDPESTAEP